MAALIGTTEEGGEAAGCLDPSPHAAPSPARDAAPTPMDAAVTLAILAGGAGTRMGGPKAWLRLAGQPIIEYLLDAIAWPGPSLLVTAPGFEHPPGWQRFTAECRDPIAGQGPLRGLLTALEHCRTDLLLAATIDMPLIRRPHLQWLHTALVARPHLAGLLPLRPAQGRPAIESFPSAYTRAAQFPLTAHLTAGRRSVRSLLSHPQFQAVDAPPDWHSRVWTNLNSIEELKAFEKEGGGE